MILVLGGIASGKRTYVRSLGYADVSMSNDPASDAPVLLDLEEALRDDAATAQTLEAALRKEVVVCHEVGSGVVPMDVTERVWRERVGRSCATLAARATTVVRMVCGIPLTLKDEEAQA